MQSQSITSRFKLLTEIDYFCRQKGIDLQNYLRLRVEKLPFKLGEGKGKVPYLFDREVAETISSSVQKLISLIKKRHERESKYPLNVYLPLPNSTLNKDILGRYLCTRDLNTRTLEKRIVEDAIYHNPHLDAGIVGGWFLQHKEGGRFIWTIRGLYLKAIEGEIKQEEWADITYLTHLCLVSFLRKTKETLKKVNIKGLSYEKLEQSVAQFLYSAIREIQDDVFDEIRSKDLIVDVTRPEYLIKGSTSPLTFVAIRPSLFKNDLNPYHLDQEGFEFLSTLIQEMDVDLHDMEGVLWNLMNRVKKNRKVKEKIIELWSINRFREAIFHYLKDYEDYRGGTNLWLFSLFKSNKLIQNTLDEEGAGKKLEEDLNKLITETSRTLGKERVQSITAIENAFKSYKKARTLRKFFFASREEEQLKEVIEGFLLYQLDEAWSTWFEESMQYLDDRETLKRQDELEEEYDRGRIYRFATDARPILQDLTIKKEGHLFMDLRGFTQRMSQTKEITTADFMLKEFFLPVLRVAKRYYIDEGVRLNNFVGDAISFSGRIESFVSLSQEIREIFDKYTTKILNKKGVPGKAEELRTIEERYQREKRALVQKREAIEESIRGIEKELELKESLNPVYLLKVQEKEFDSMFSHYQQEIASLPKQIEVEEDHSKQKNFMDLRENLLLLRKGINEQKRELAERASSIGDEELQEVFRLVCAEEREELERLRELLTEMYDKELELASTYEKDIASLRNEEVEYSLFISYGDAAEIISFQDEFWGKMNVAIAEKLNEAARGTGRNTDVRKKLDSLLRSTRWARQNPSLEYPFYVFIDKSYWVSFRSDLSMKVDVALQGRDMKSAKEVVKAASSLLMKDIEKGMSGYGEDGWDILSSHNDIYNLGEAMSEEALHAYLRETSPHQYHFSKSIKTNELHPEIQNGFLFPSGELKFFVGVKRKDTTVDFDLFRYAGELVFRGFEGSKATVVYEIVRKSSRLYHLLTKYHLMKWYQESREKVIGIRAAEG